MSRIKRLLDEMMEDMFNTPLFQLDEMFNRKQIENQQLEEETFEVTKGQFKTNISCKFTKQGEPVGISYKSTYVPTEEESKQNQLELELEKALENEDYLKAADIKKQLEGIKGEQKVIESEKA